MKIYNEFKESFEDFVHDPKSPVRIFVCGPTLYDKIHLGHLKVLLYSDLIVRYFKFKGFDVEPILNLTDMDFKIIERAKEENLKPDQIVEKYYNESRLSFEKINLSKDFIVVRTSEVIEKAVKITRELIEKRLAYFLEDGIFCDTSFSKNLGKLSKIPKEKMQEMILEPNIKKRNPADFRIWIKIKEDFCHETIFGKGFVGWHMQDYSVIEQYFNGEYDFHIGAKDLIYPHHELILLLGEYYRNKFPIANYFIHTGVITKNGEKMSKSLGNVIYLDELLSKYDSDDLRVYIFRNSSKDDVEFKIEELEEARKIKNEIKNIDFKKSNNKVSSLSEVILKYYKDFMNNLENNFSVNLSIKCWIDLNNFIKENDLNEVDANLIKKVYRDFSQITGILSDHFSKE